MTLSLELGGIRDPDVRRAFEVIAQHFPIQPQDFSNSVLLLAATGTARKVTFGLSTVNAGATGVIAHGLGTTPASVVATANTGGGVNIVFVVTATDATNISLKNTSGTNSNVFWIAIG